MVRKLTAILACILLSASAQATLKTWSGGAAGDWWTSGNWTPSGIPQAGDDVIINSSSTVILSNATPYLSSLNISNTATLTFTNWTTSLSATNIVVTNTALITCGGPFTNNAMSNRVWLICSNLTVSPNASIDVSAKGYGNTVANSPGQGPGAGGGGGAFDPGGGGYGGQGGAGTSYMGGKPYDTAQNAGLPGSGGGNWSGGLFGLGGGAVWISASGTVTVAGAIKANGNNGSSRSAGGSGGGIHVDSYAMAGTGIVSVAGGSGTQYGGGGGSGGRIAVTYNSAAQLATTQSITFSALGGYGQYGVAGGYMNFGQGQLGTLYFPDKNIINPALITSSGQLIIPNLTNCACDSFVVSNGWLQCTMDGVQLTVTNNLIVSGTMGRFDFSGPIQFVNSNASSITAVQYYSTLTNPANLYVGGSVIITNGGVLGLFAAATNSVHPDNGCLLAVTNDILIYSNSWIAPYSHGTNGGSVKITCRSMSILATNAGINANGRGYSGVMKLYGAGLGPGGGLNLGNYDGAGGSYGGIAGYSSDWGGVSAGNYQPPTQNADQAPTATYGDPINPLSPGSAGGNYQYGFFLSSGGGLVRIVAISNVLVNGQITANGLSPLGTLERAGGGAGGGINIICGTITGTNGLISAAGGSTTQFGGSGGGGGRIAIVYTNTTAQKAMPYPNVVITALGGYGAGTQSRGFDYFLSGAGDLGTIYMPDLSIIDPNWVPISGRLIIPGFTNWSVDHLNISNGWLRIPSDGFVLTITNDLNISGTTGRFEIVGSSSNYWNQYISLAQTASTITVGGNLIVTNGATFVACAAPTNTPNTAGATVSVGKDIVVYKSWIIPNSHATNGGSVWFTAANLWVNGTTNAGFNANYRGCIENSTGPNGNGFGAGGGGWYNGTGGGGGAGYGGGGAGGLSGGSALNGGPAYGSSNAPMDCGSGGGRNGVDNSGSRASGGGLIKVSVTDTAQLNGCFLADGYGAGRQGARDGGGSGGGINISAKYLQGTQGLFSVVGGAGTATYGGSGGGGRIALSASQWSYASGLVYTNFAGQTGGAIGTNGTTYLYFPSAYVLQFVGAINGATATLSGTANGSVFKLTTK